MSEYVITEIKDQVAWLTLNRPEVLNAIDEDMKTAIIDALVAVEHDDNVRAVVIRGAGAHFLAGGDIASFHADLNRLEGGALRHRAIERVHRTKLLIASITRMKKPVIASVHGHAAGLGLSLAMMCDLTVAADDAVFSLAYIHIGLNPDGGGSYILPRIVGVKKAIEIAMLGQRIEARDAERLGMVNFVYPAAELGEQTEKLTKRLARAPTMAMGNIKKLMHASLSQSFDTQLQMEAECISEVFGSEDVREGVTAFVEKRRPNYKGR